MRKWPNDMNICYRKEDAQMTNKYIRKYPMSLGKCKFKPQETLLQTLEWLK
jgi:hypothetical protein